MRADGTSFLLKFSAGAGLTYHVTGIDFVEQVLDYFNVTYSVRETEKQHIPSIGKAVIIANHPIGSLDGLALLKMIHNVRPDVKVMANQMLMSVNALHDLLLR